MSHDVPKIIWILWFQGWDNAPQLVRLVRQSWQHHNPAWTIISLDDGNLNEYIDIVPLPDTTYQAKSDIIRLHLLDKYGGVWADATMVCMQPLDTWVHSALQPSGFWMYHGRDKGRGPASWFIISCPGSYIIRKWYESCVRFWNEKPRHVEYYWMDRLFANLAHSDPKFFNEWRNVPFKYCEEYGSSHCANGKVYAMHPELINFIHENPPFAIKLCYRGHLHPNTNAWHILRIAFENKVSQIVTWEQPPSFVNANFFEV